MPSIIRLFQPSKTRTNTLLTSIIAFCILLVLTHVVWSSYSQWTNNRNHTASLYAKMIESNVSRTFESLEVSLISLYQTLTALDQSVIQTTSTLPETTTVALSKKAEKALSEQIRRTLLFAPHIRQIVITAKGKVIFDSTALYTRQADESAFDTSAVDKSTLDSSTYTSTINKIANNKSTLNRKLLGFDTQTPPMANIRIGKRLNQRFLPLTKQQDKTKDLRALIPVQLVTHTPNDSLQIYAVINPDYILRYITGLELAANDKILMTNFQQDNLISVNCDCNIEEQVYELTDEILQQGRLQGEHTRKNVLLPVDFTYVQLSEKYPLAIAVNVNHSQGTFALWRVANSGFFISLILGVFFVIWALFLLLSFYRRSYILQQKIHLLSSSVEQSPVATIITDENLNINFTNRAFIELFDDNQSLSSQQAHRHVIDLITAHRHQALWQGELDIFNKQGELRTLDATFFNAQHNIDQTQHSISLFTDSTAKNLSLKRIQLLSQVVENSPVVVIITDVNGRIQYANKMFEQVSGFQVDEVLGKTPNILKSDKTNTALYHELWGTITQGNVWQGEIENRHKNGAFYWERVNVSSLTDEQGEISHFIAVKEVITLQKENEKQQRLASAVFRTASEAIMVTDLNNRIQMVNQSFTRITGYSTQDVINLTPKILKSGRHDKDFYSELYKQLTEQGHWEGEIWNKRKNGEAYPQWVNISIMRDSRNQPEGFVALFNDITKRKQNEEIINHQANFDALTGLPNRHQFSQKLNNILQKQTGRQQGALLFIDLDRFKQVNDTLGHSVGDLLLKEVSIRLQGCLRDKDIPARLGGDEFAVIMPKLTSLTKLNYVAERILHTLSAPYFLDGHDIYISVSIGISVFPVDGNEAEVICRNADSAMYKSKENGRNDFQFFTEKMNQSAQRKREIEIALRQALDSDQLSMHFQPIWNAEQTQILSAESLIRWKHPQQGYISPAEFIPLAEDIGIINEIGEWVLRQSCRVGAQLARSTPVPINVNVSSKQFQRRDMVTLIQRVLHDTTMPAHLLVIEITESLLISHVDDTYQQLDALHKLGIKIAIDDFGTGYSSLSYLKKFPITKLKIDQSFIQDICLDADDRELVKTIVAMAENLSMQSIAEGVETQQQADLLRNMGCQAIQGYLYNKPMPEHVFVTNIKEHYNVTQ